MRLPVEPKRIEADPPSLVAIAMLLFGLAMVINRIGEWP